MATASMQNRGPPRQAQQPTSSSASSTGQQHVPTAARIKTPSSSAPSTSPAPHHHHHHHHTRESSNDQQKYLPLNPSDSDLGANLAIRRSTWGRKNSSAGSGTTGPAGLGNRANTPTSSHSRTNSPTPPVATNAWTQKADERAAHDQLTHLLYTLTVLPHNFPPENTKNRNKRKKKK